MMNFRRKLDPTHMDGTYLYPQRALDFYKEQTTLSEIWKIDAQMKMWEIFGFELKFNYLKSSSNS